MFLLLILLFAGALLFATFYLSSLAKEDLAQGQIDQAFSQVEQGFDAFRTRIQGGFAEVEALAKAGLLHSSEDPQTKSLLSSLKIARPEIRFLGLQVNGNSSLVSPETQDFPKLLWSQPRLLPSSKVPSIPLRLGVLGKEGPLWFRFELSLSPLVEDFQRISQNKAAQIVLLDADRRILALSPFPKSKTEAQTNPSTFLLKPIAETPLPLLRNGYDAWEKAKENGQPLGAFASEGEVYWGKMQALSLGHGLSLWVGLGIPERQLSLPFTQFRWWILGVFLLLVLLALPYINKLAKEFTHPLEQMILVSEQISQGQLESHYEPETCLIEVQQLAHAQDRMREALRSLFKMEGDMRVARAIQQASLPKNLPNVPGFELAAWSEAAEETGGDCYDVVRLDIGPLKGSIALLLADATGHGIGPALSVMQLRSMFRVGARAGQEPIDVLRWINEQLCDDLPGGRFITSWFGILLPEEGKLRFRSAGQAPLFYLQESEGIDHRFPADTPPLGIDPEIDFRRDPREVRMRKGDLFVVLSDGIFEAKNPREEQFGAERALAAIRGPKEMGPGERLTHLREALSAFCEDRPPDDDRTALLIQGV
jgi:serine phosphatase RsbU (regulator of sigma subunit)